MADVICLVVLFSALVLVAKAMDYNATMDYMRMDEGQFASRQAKLITFNTLEQGDIAVELAFNVPFITIPIKKSVDMAKGAMANVNIGAIVLAGAMALGFGILIPALVLFMSKKKVYSANGNSGGFPGYRSDDSPADWFQILTSMENTFSDNNMDIGVCVQRMICWTVKNSSKNVSQGHSSSLDKIVDGVATNQWFQNLVSGTAIEEALRKGLKDTNCAKEYSRCKITQKSLQGLTQSFVGIINRK